ncbi:MAG: DUF177 domain-containing protein [Candidatus Omnitrophota bacterium]
MRIEISSVPSVGQMSLEEKLLPENLDLDTPHIHFDQPIRVTHLVSKGKNSLSADSRLESGFTLTCCRCLKEISVPLSRRFKNNLHVDSSVQFVDTIDWIREEIMLNYPLKPLCKAECLGLCKICGVNLNERGCSCAST